MRSAREAAMALDRIRDVMSEYLSDECVPMSELLAALDGEVCHCDCHNLTPPYLGCERCDHGEET